VKKFPVQGSRLNKPVQVTLETSEVLTGVCVRDDMSEPYLTIIRLDDGRHVLGTECLYR
jgi:hypothetical protein